MPELPEVENLRRGLEKHILGQKILKVVVSKPKIVSGKGNIRLASRKKVSEFINGLTKEKFVSIERRAKNLIFNLTNQKKILVHLKMTGQFVYQDKRLKKVLGGHPIEISETTLPNKHTHIIFYLSDGTLFYNDTRMFGYVLYYQNQRSFDRDNHFEKLGKEPLEKDFTEKYFYQSLKDKNSSIKAVLMNQDVVTGVGNIYADESLFQSKIDPRRRASNLSLAETKKLHSSIINIMKKAIKAGGSSVATYRLIDETRGNYAREHKVYGRFGEKCLVCNKELKKIQVQNRTTVFCAKCQK